MQDIINSVWFQLVENSQAFSTYVPGLGACVVASSAAVAAKAFKRKPETVATAKPVMHEDLRGLEQLHTGSYQRILDGNDSYSEWYKKMSWEVVQRSRARAAARQAIDKAKATA